MTHLEDTIRTFCGNDDYNAATTEAIRAYGPEILGYLVATVRDDTVASDIFSVFCEDLWKGIAAFRWQSSFRTWMYTVARHAMSRTMRSPKARPNLRGAHLPLSKCPEVHAIAQNVRTATLPHLRTESKDGLARLRDRLSPEERMLLILRHDRHMPWKEIGVIMADDPNDPAATTRKMNALKKKYKRLIPRLREMAIEEGLMPSE